MYVYDRTSPVPNQRTPSRLDCLFGKDRETQMLLLVLFILKNVYTYIYIILYNFLYYYSVYLLKLIVAPVLYG
jgi:hypothetical protein